MGINNQCFGCHFLRLLLHGYSFNTSVMRIAAGSLRPVRRPRCCSHSAKTT
jgi:hypothetical protein